MEIHKCKLCSRSFPNGRSLGGHMKAHFATFPLTPKQLGRRDSVSPAASSSDEKPSSVNGLRENPKKSVRLADREFSITEFISIVQDRESETESRNPTRRRSKRTRRPNIELNQPMACWAELLPELSSVSDTSPEEDVAMCLVMLSMDKPLNRRENSRKREIDGEDRTPETGKPTEEIDGLGKFKSKKIRARNRCENCQISFRSNQALNGHRKICSQSEEHGNRGNWKIFKCPYCCKLFGSGQALGGHKRSHLVGSTSTRTAIDADSSIIFDLNLPAPVEEDDYSVVSDA